MAEIVRLNSAVDTPAVIALLEQRRVLQEIIAMAEEEKRGLDAGLLERLYEWKKWWPTADAFEFPSGARLREGKTPPRRVISAEKLLAQGVAPDVIEAASSWSKPSDPYLRVDYIKTDAPE